MKIKKVDIDNFGSFNRYNWNSAISRDYTFKGVNIIYGRNYSGKTTLSKIFKCVENKKLHNDYDSPQFNITLDDLSTIDNSTVDNSNIDICVYNTDFVKENLNWLHNEDGTIEPFTVLGGVNNEIEKQIKVIVEELGDKPEDKKDEYKKGLYFEFEDAKIKYDKAFSKHKKSNDGLEKKLKEKANQEIKTNSIYKNVTYNIGSIKKDIQKIKSEVIEPLNGDEIEKHKQLIKEDIKPDVTLLPESKPNFGKYFSDVKEIIGTKIKPSKPIQELLNDSLLQEWVRNGRAYHENKRDVCAFCGNPINENLWKKLDDHFNKESESLRDEIKEKINSLNSAKDGLSSFIKFSEETFYSSYQDKIKILLEEWNILKTSYEDNIQKLIDKLNLRSENIFNEIEIEDIKDVSDSILELIKKINIIIKQNNDKTKTLSEDQNKSREILRLSEISKFLQDIDYNEKIEDIEKLKQDEDAFKQEKERVNGEIKSKEETKRQLETGLKDESRGAELVNEYLENFFGNNGFKLVALDEDTGVKYKIIRDGKEAKNLSEGECSLISFCYFVAKVKDKLDSNHNNLILYIDDPISSLDSNHIFFIFSLIESIITKPKKYKQLFISTHNLDFLKYIKRLTVNKDDLIHFLIETEQKQNHRRSTLRLMPEHLKNYTTEFNYLFNEIYKLYKEINSNRAMQISNTYNQFYNIPNNLRKFLEYYLFYKYPNSNSPLDNLDRLFDGHIPLMLQRLINEYSHLTFIDRGWSPMDVQEVEECVKVVIEKIKDKDEDQYNALKQSIGA